MNPLKYHARRYNSIFLYRVIVAHNLRLIRLPQNWRHHTFLTPSASSAPHISHRAPPSAPLHSSMASRRWLCRIWLNYGGGYGYPQIPALFPAFPQFRCRNPHRLAVAHKNSKCLFQSRPAVHTPQRGALRHLRREAQCALLRIILSAA